MSVCQRCGAQFSCAMLGEQDGPCWCTALPPIVPLPGDDASCLCPHCLKIEIAARQASPPSS